MKKYKIIFDIEKPLIDSIEDNFIFELTGKSSKNNNDKIINANHDAMGNKAIAFVGTSGVQLGWLASQADMLAEDWKIAEEEN